MARDQLAGYRRKRDFGRTPEPAGGVAPSDGGRRFVVQRHRASRLHYDLRFELDGVLVSWAVPKGPTLDANVRRGAFHVEDHPIDYLHFEGVIPAGQYGGGDVIVWDTGTWRPYKSDDPAGELTAGELHAEVFGEKLRGQFVVVRTNADKDEWLLLHKHDDFAVDGWDAEDHPKSVLSGRTNDEVKADPDRLWRSDLPAARASVQLKARADDELAQLDGLGKSGTWRVFGRDLRVTGLDKVLFEPRTQRAKPVTKRELLRYAACVAPTVLPYLTHRALELRGRPVVDEPGDLVRAVNGGAVEWRVGSARADRPDRPTHLVIEIDDTARWTDVLTLARLYRTAFEQLGLTGCPKLNGLGGIELWLPIAPGPATDEAHAWGQRLTEVVGAVVPGLAPLARVAGDTVLAPYSPRKAPGAPVSAPIEWSELDDGRRLRPDRFTIRTVLDRIAERGDLFAGVLARPQRLPSLE